MYTCIMYIVQCTLFIVHCTMYSVHWIFSDSIDIQCIAIQSISMQSIAMQGIAMHGYSYISMHSIAMYLAMHCIAKYIGVHNTIKNDMRSAMMHSIIEPFRVRRIERILKQNMYIVH